VCSSDLKVYCANELPSGSVVVIDGTTNELIARVTGGRSPWTFCYNPQNDKVYCANNLGGNVTVIDGEADIVLATVPVGTEPSALLFDVENNKVYCANYASGSVTVIDGATDTVVCTIDVGGGPYAFAHNPMQNRVYVANPASSSISVIRDSMMVGIEESLKPQASRSKPAATVVRSLPVGAVVFDASGRRVVNPKSGIYFVRAVSRELSAVGCQRVIIQR
jgi:YVTN family beta-propeller protein